VADAQVAGTDRTGWFNRTGWPEHVANRNLALLAHARRLPDRDEEELQQAARVVDLLVERCVAGLSTLALEMRRWLKSAKREEVDVRPMGRLQNPESQKRYARYWKQFVCYCLRIVAAEEEEGIVDTLGCKDNGPACGDDNGDDDGNGNGDAGGRNAGDDDASQIEEDDNSDDDNCEDNSEDDGPDSEVGTDKDGTKFLRDARALFRWQARQKRLAKELWHSLQTGEDEKGLTEQVLQLSAAFIFQSVGSDPFDSGLIHFLAVLGIDEDLKRLRTANDFSFMLAGVVYCTRVLAAESLLPSAARAEQGDAERTGFLNRRKQFLADGSFSPMSTMLSLLAYSKAAALNHRNPGSIFWSKDRKIVYLHGRPIVIERFRRMVGDAVTEAERLLWQELMWVHGQEGRFSIALDQVEDDVTFTKRGVSFVSKASNRIGDGLEWMLEQMRRSETGRKMWAKDAWHARRVRRYVRKVDTFLELLLFVVHTTGGQPARGTEITSCRHRNGFLQDRNIFVMDGQVVFVTRYHKSQSLLDTPKVIPRFLPGRVGQLVALYLAYVLPLQERLAEQVQRRPRSDYVWAGEHGPWETHRLTRVIVAQSAAVLNNRLTTLEYRHAAIAIGREFVDEGFGAGTQDEVGEGEELEVDADSPLEMSAGRTGQIGVNRYGVPSDVVKHLSVRSLRTFRPLSEAWHRFLGMAGGGATEVRSKLKGASIGSGGASAGRKHRRGPSDAPTTPAPRQKRRPAATAYGPAEVEKAVRQALGKTGTSVLFRSKEQERGLEAVLAGQTPLVVVLPTGGGKSLLFMAPACLAEPGVTVVVVPFRALLGDMVQRMKDVGIACMEWRAGEVNPAAVVVVSADRAAEWDFMDYASRLNQDQLLRRVVIDECHLTFTSSDWRPKLAQLRSLRLLRCPIVLLTATLPPLLEHELGEAMLIPLATYIRASTVRASTRYAVQWCAPGKVEETAVAVCRRQQSRLGGRKGVVYCRAKAQCEDVARELGCPYYHGGVVGREEGLERWLGAGGWIVATSALGTGVNFPEVVFVLHLGLPYGMIDYAQESGRAGRGGEAVDSVVLLEDGEVERRARYEAVSVDRSAMAAFVETTGCRRGVMSRYLDGEEVTCTGMDCAACDRCGEGLVDWRRSQRKDAEEQQRVRGLLDELSDGCPVCWTLGARGEDSHLHSSVGCRRVTGLGEVPCDEFRRKIRYEPSSHTCTKCGISQQLCATGKDGEARCQWSNVLIPVVRAAAETAGGLGVVREAGFEGEVGGDLGGYGKWLGQRHTRRKWGFLMSNAMVVLIEMVLYINDEGRQGREAEQLQEAVQLQKETQQEEKQPQGELQVLVWQLNRWRSFCVICLLSEQEFNHGLGGCKSDEGRQILGVCAQVERKVGRVSGSGCYECRAPREVCERWKKDSRTGRLRQSDQGCQFKGVMVRAIFGILSAYPAIWREWTGRLRSAGVDTEDYTALGKYLAGRRVKGGAESNGLTVEFGWLTGKVEASGLPNCRF